MFPNQLAKNETAIARFRAHEKVEVSATTVYAVYTSGNFVAFYATEQEAIDHCASPENGVEFNGQWYQDRYQVFTPGELFAIPGNESVYVSNDRSRYIDAAMGRWQIPFVKWEAERPLSV